MSLFRQAFLVLTALLCASQTVAQTLPAAPTLAAKSWLLLEIGSGQTLAAEKADERLDPASLTKLMTAYLTFAALRQKTLGLDQTLPVSEKAWRTGGSKMFVRVNHQVPVDDLIKGVVVQSGNDACVVLAEGIGGSEENFAHMMNRAAERLGMKNSNFRNATGLPDPQHYSTARDLSILAAALIRDFPEEYRRYYSIKEFSYNNIKQPNRNRLLWLDPSVDGMKTGYTKAAGYCLISSAQRDQRRLLSVVLGTDADATRTRESKKLLDWGFAAFAVVPLYTKEQTASALRVWKGAQNEVKAGFAHDIAVSVPRDMADKLKAEIVPHQPLLAPIAAGQQIATLKLSLDGKAYGEQPVLALEAVPPAGIFGRALDSVRLWFN
ncbi:MAG: D-alanyl-D-alanine carboxypeptidase [Betaproteobacteria bacterium]|nr:D-alanyl-D-alanine carboxypeptidase [Betaproteobacteria bacterium]MCL2886652.1 D-alanyl-D-alanine carboxypeptidase [Betaproteobacteria bacterium]